MTNAFKIRATAIFSMVVGLLFLTPWIGTVIFAFRSVVTQNESDSYLTPLLAPLLAFPLLIPPGMTIIYGRRLFSSPTKSNIKGAIGGLTVSSAFIVVALLKRALQLEVEGNYIFFLTALIAVPIYSSLSKHLIDRLLNQPIIPGEFVGAGIIGIFAFQMWAALSTFSANNGSSESAPGMILPIIIAYLFYRGAMWLRPKPTEPKTESPTKVRAQATPPSCAS